MNIRGQVNLDDVFVVVVVVVEVAAPDAAACGGGAFGGKGKERNKEQGNSSVKVHERQSVEQGQSSISESWD